MWNAIVATGTSASTYGKLFDTVSVCLSKGLGAPVGSLILGTSTNIERARRWRKMLGGGMRQAGILAAAGLYALDTVLPRISEDHRRAQKFATGLADIDGVTIDLSRVQTNIVAFSVSDWNDAEFVQACRQRGLRIAPIRAGVMRAVMYHQIDDSAVEQSLAVIRDVLENR